MSGKQMEGDNRERRKKAKEARDEGKLPSEEAATAGSSKQREHVSDDVDHREKIETIRKGKQDVIAQNTPEPKPGYAEDSKD
jgi:hypothetical protein